MKILLLSTHLNAGGITRYLYILSKGLIEKRVTVFLATSGGDCSEDFKQLGVELIDVDIKAKSILSPKIYRALFALAKIVKSENIDIIHAQTRVAQWLGFWLNCLTHKPYMSTCHGFFRARLLRRMTSNWGDSVIAISPAVKDHLVDDFGVIQEKIAVIPHGIDLEEFSVLTDDEKQKKREAFHLRRETPVVGIIARLSDVKGHDILIKAMGDVVKSHPGVKLLVFGEGKMKAELEELVDQYGLKDDVLFYSITNTIRNILPLFDIFVMPSRQEGLGLSVMEAQAVGLPVVASNVGGLTALIEDGKTGVLVEPQNEKKLAQGINRLLEDKNLAAQVGQNARAFIERELTVGKMIDETMGVYKRVGRSTDN